MMDKVILQVHTILCMIIVIIQSAAVPDNVVWTPPILTLWLGHTDPSLTCEYIGAPYAVYWLKDSKTILTWYTKPQPSGTLSYGQGIDGSRFGITADHHTLLFNDLTESDAGTYTCKVSNYNGFIISNQTEVRVLDPQNSVAYTKPNITTWKGSSEYLPCDFTGTASKVLWNKIDNSRQPPAVETVLRYADDTYEVIGTNSRFSWNENYQLHLRDIEVLDGANYTCKVWKPDGTQLQNSTIMTVYALPEEPYVQIAQCGGCMVGQGDQNCVKCTHNVTADAESFTLGCSITGAKPKVTNIMWSEGATGRVINDTQVVYTKGEDGTFDTRATLSVRLLSIADATSFTCTATGKAANDTWDSEETISVRILPAHPSSGNSGKPGLSSGEKAALSIFLLLLLLIVLFLLVFAYLYRYHRSKLLSTLPHQVINCCTCLDLKPKPTNDGTLEEKKPLANETTDPLIAILREKRDKIDNYIPGSMSQHVFSKDKIFNIGLYGIMSAGKSAFVNSLSFAVKGEYKAIAEVAKIDQGGSTTLYRETLPLTRQVHAVDTKGMQDFRESYIESILDEIRGKRGQDPKKKVSDGKEIHCPVFVLKSSDAGGPDVVTPFLNQLSNGVHKKFGRHVLVVITHKDELAKEIKETDQQDEMSGDQNDAHYQGIQQQGIESSSNCGSEDHEYNTPVLNEHGTVSATADEDMESKAGGDNANKRKSSLNLIKDKFDEYMSKKKGREKSQDIEEGAEIVNVDGKKSEVVVVNKTASVSDPEEQDKEQKVSTSNDMGSIQPGIQTEQQTTAGEDSDVKTSDDPAAKFESGKENVDVVVRSECMNVTHGGGNTLTKWKKKIVDHTKIPEQNIWAFENYTIDNHDEDRERSIEFLDFLTVCLDTAERNAKFREEYKLEKKSTKRQILHPGTWFKS